MYLLVNIQYTCMHARAIIPMCQSELGPGTEYGLLAVMPLGPRKALLIGSIALIALLTLSRVTLYPKERS